MTVSPEALMNRVNLSVEGTVRWGESVPISKPGVYILSMDEDPRGFAEVLGEASIDLTRVSEWLARVPGMTLEGKERPAAQAVAAYLKQFWLPQECILYVGKATSLRSRLRGYRSHTLGDARPHKGGHWIKTLANLERLFIHYASVSTPIEAERKEGEMLAVFVEQVSDDDRRRLVLPIPFANMEHPKGNRKQRGLGRQVL